MVVNGGRFPPPVLPLEGANCSTCAAITGSHRSNELARPAPSFQTRTRMARSAVVVQPDGKILIGGDFTALSLNGGAAVTRTRMARLNPDGTSTRLLIRRPTCCRSIAVQADGSILAGGSSQHRPPEAQLIARLDAVTGPAIHSTQTRTSESIQSSSGGRQDSSGRHLFDRIGGQGRRHIDTARCEDRIGRFVRPEPDALGSMPSRFRQTADFGSRLFEAGGQDRNSVAG